LHFIFTHLPTSFIAYLLRHSLAFIVAESYT
jgi:hypothetical protein